MDPGWHAKFCERGTRVFKFVKDNIHDETHRTLPKTNERDQRNQPLPQNCDEITVRLEARSVSDRNRHEATASDRK